MKKINKKILSYIYKVGKVISNPLYLIFFIWAPLMLIIFLLNYNIVTLEVMNYVLLALSIPIVYFSILISRENRKRKKKIRKLMRVGVEVFGTEERFRKWMYSNNVNYGKAHVELEVDKVREILHQIQHGVYV